MQRFHAEKRPNQETVDLDGKKRQCDVYVLDNVWRDGHTAEGLKFSSLVYIGLADSSKSGKVQIYMQGAKPETVGVEWRGGGYHVRKQDTPGRVQVVDLDGVGLRVFHELVAMRG